MLLTPQKMKVLLGSVKFLIHDWDVVLNGLSVWFANGLFFFLIKKLYDLCITSCRAAGILFWWPALQFMFEKLCHISYTIFYKTSPVPMSTMRLHRAWDKPHIPRRLWSLCCDSHCEQKHSHAQEPVPFGNSHSILLLPSQLFQCLAERQYCKIHPLLASGRAAVNNLRTIATRHMENTSFSLSWHMQIPCQWEFLHAEKNLSLVVEAPYFLWNGRSL